jgi:hypothetical protein
MASEIDKRPYVHECGKTNYIFCPACVYAEGRKAAEKDFQELLKLADRLKFSGSYFPDGLEDEFDAWKKARGIE